MYSVFIIDDDIDTVSSLTKLIPWEELNMTVIGHAYNGTQGKEYLSTTPADIIISDISMPSMDGLSMIEELRSAQNHSKVIFITSFEKIQYATKAIKLAAFDFILKPIDNDEIIATLKRAAEALDKELNHEIENAQLESAAKTAKFILALTNSCLFDDTDFCRELFAPDTDRYFFVAANGEAGINQSVLQRTEYMQFPESVQVTEAVIDNELILLCSMRKQDSDKDWQSAALDVGYAISNSLVGFNVAVSAIHSDIREYIDAYRECRQALLWHSVYGRHTKIEFYNYKNLYNSKNSKLQEIEQLCLELAADKNYSFEDIWEAVQRKSAGRMRIIRLMLLNYASKVVKLQQFSNSDTNMLNNLIYDITSFNTEEEAKSWLHSFENEKLTVEKPMVPMLIDSIMEYIRAHATEHITLEKVGKAFYLSPNHISSLISKETGTTYKHHVINARMDIAKNLLDNTRMSIEEVAYAVNYENYTSFYNVFRKTVGLNPSEYRFRK